MLIWFLVSPGWSWRASGPCGCSCGAFLSWGFSSLPGVGISKPSQTSYFDLWSVELASYHWRIWSKWRCSIRPSSKSKLNESGPCLFLKFSASLVFPMGRSRTMTRSSSFISLSLHGYTIMLLFLVLLIPNDSCCYIMLQLREMGPKFLAHHQLFWCHSCCSVRCLLTVE